jgi:DNA-binding FadR family transcriptional regulator
MAPREFPSMTPNAAPARRAARFPASTPAPSTTADRVVAALVAHIRRHRLRAGESLPSELQTSSRLHVSRSVVREAYRSLS